MVGPPEDTGKRAVAAGQAISRRRSFLQTDAGLLDDATPDFHFRPEKCANTFGSVRSALVTERLQASMNAWIAERGNGIGVHFRDDLRRGLGRHKEAVPRHDIETWNAAFGDRRHVGRDRGTF